MLNGHPIAARFDDDPGFGERFWYWRGASGRSFIHSIYTCEACPPLPGAVFVAVRRTGGQRQPVGVGRFPVVIEAVFDISRMMPDLAPADEIHVHLLARDDASAERVQMDLRAALDSVETVPAARPAGFRKAVQLELIAA
jgi:hypothetical protein